MLDLTGVDVATLAEALEDRSTEWWFDPRNGQLEPWIEDLDDDELEHPHDRGLRLVETIGSSEAYGDMEDFVSTVPGPRARDLLTRAITGKGAFRRFKDTLYEFPDLREAWFALEDARMRRRALHWLAAEGLVEAGVVERAIAGVRDPSAPRGRPMAGTLVTDPVETAVAAVRRFCAERTPADDRDQLVVEAERRGSTIGIVERHAPWDPAYGPEWTVTPVAQLRFDPSRNRWSLHARRGDRWIRHPDTPIAADIADLLHELDADPYGLFWG